MDEFKSEEELRSDSSDRHSLRHQRTGPTMLKVPVSRQYLMIGISILVLLLLVISISAALKSTPCTDSSRHGADNNDQRHINLFGSDVTASSLGAPVPAVNGSDGTFSPRELRRPQFASTSTEAAPIIMSSEQQHGELLGNMTAALTQQGNQINDDMAEQMNDYGLISTLPTAAATLTPDSRSSVKPHKSAAKAFTNAHCKPKQTPTVPNASRQTAAGAPKMTSSAKTLSTAVSSVTVESAVGTIQSAPAGYYTLQLSSASQPATLNTYARQQQLNYYWVYQTRRNGKPWYVLVNGVYPSLSQAKNAVAQLPADVRAKKPWARQIDQIRKDQNN